MLFLQNYIAARQLYSFRNKLIKPYDLAKRILGKLRNRFVNIRRTKKNWQRFRDFTVAEIGAKIRLFRSLISEKRFGNCEARDGDRAVINRGDIPSPVCARFIYLTGVFCKFR